MIAAFAPASFAGAFANKCVACHKADAEKGLAKASKADLLKKYKTADGLVAGAKEVTNPLMKSIQGDETSLRDAAADLGLK